MTRIGLTFLFFIGFLGLSSQSVNAQDAESLFARGWAYANGDGVPQSRRDACDWWRKAAEAGHGWGAHNTGWCYRDGDFGAPDETRALEWFLTGRGSRNLRVNDPGWVMPMNTVSSWRKTLTSPFLGTGAPPRADTPTAKTISEQCTRTAGAWSATMGRPSRGT